MRTTPTTKGRLRRPVGVVMLVIIQLLLAALLLLSLTVEGVVVDLGPLTEALAPVLLVALVIVAFGLWRLQRWAWSVVMLVTGLILAVSLVDYIRGEPSYMLMLLSVIVVFYLNQRDLQRAFRKRDQRDELDPVT